MCSKANIGDIRSACCRCCLEARKHTWEVELGLWFSFTVLFLTISRESVSCFLPIFGRAQGPGHSDPSNWISALFPWGYFSLDIKTAITVM